MVPILGWVVGVKKHRMDTTRQELFFLTGGHQLFLWFEQVEENSGSNQESIDYHKTILKELERELRKFWKMFRCLSLTVLRIWRWF